MRLFKPNKSKRNEKCKIWGHQRSKGHQKWFKMNVFTHFLYAAKMTFQNANVNFNGFSCVKHAFVNI